MVISTSVDALPMTFKVRPKRLFGLFFQRLRRRSPPDFGEFSLAARDVIATRMSLAVTGKLTATEARRMVEEKRLAAVRAQIACMEAILNGEPASAPRAYFDVYRRAVESNRRRLSTRRWRWFSLP